MPLAGWMGRATEELSEGLGAGIIAIGVLQATEALKVLLGIGEPLIGRLMLWDALEGSFTELAVKRDPHCVACGDGANGGAA